MRVLLATDGLSCGGKERQLTELAIGLATGARKPPIEVGVISLDARGFYDDLLTQHGITVWHLPRLVRWDILLPIRMGRTVARFAPDVIHSFSAMATFYLSIIPRGRAALIDNSIRNTFAFRSPFERYLFKWNFSRSELVCSNSQLGLACREAPLQKASVLYNGYRFDRQISLIPSDDLRLRLGVGHGHAVVTMVARFGPDKDWQTFFEMVRLVCARKSAVTFLAVGDGPQRHRYESEARELPVKFLGWRTDIDSIIAASDVGVLCSPLEGIPNAVLEFMAAGKPTVAACGGAIAELVADRETGFIVVPADATTLADRILLLLGDRRMADSIGVAAQRSVRDRFSMDRCVGSALSLYECACLRRAG